MTVLLDQAGLSRVMPMYLVLDGDGFITQMGPTLAKVVPQALGRHFCDVFNIRRPARVRKITDLAGRAGERLRLSLIADPETQFRGTFISTADGGGGVINLSFGIGVVDAVARHGLTDSDFAATDLTVEMLYLVEAKTAVTEELRALNTRLQGAKIKAEEQARTDTLTGLKNRRALDAALKGLIDSSMPFGLMHVDLDYFKQVNDTLGHAAGDEVLKTVAAIMRRETRAADFIARVGGDEFVLLLPGLTEASTLAKVAARIITGLQEPIPFEDKFCRISGSIGMTASSLYELPDAEKMMADADEATYASKRGGRSQAHFFDQPDQAA